MTLFSKPHTLAPWDLTGMRSASRPSHLAALCQMARAGVEPCHHRLAWFPHGAAGTVSLGACPARAALRGGALTIRVMGHVVSVSGLTGSSPVRRTDIRAVSVPASCSLTEDSARDRRSMSSTT